MGRFNILGVATEGLRLIRREPRAVLAWAGVLFLTAGLAGWLIVSQMIPVLMSLVADGTEESGEVMGRFEVIFGFAPLAWLWGMAGYLVVCAAILRAVITPEDRRRAYLRLSKAELWMVVSAVVGVVGFYIVSVVGGMIGGILLILPMVMAAMISGSDASPGLGFLPFLFGLVMLVAEVALLYVLCRLSLAPVMSFAERRFRLFEAWRFTRGAGWRLVAVALLILLAVLVVEAIVFGALFAAIGPGLLQPIPDPAALEALQEVMMRVLLFIASPAGLVASAVMCLAIAALLALTVAPWGRAYVALRDSAPSV